MERWIRVVSVGGGGGQSAVLGSLREFHVWLDAFVPVTDSGGSTHKLHHDYGTLSALGDLTKCMVAMMENRELADLLMHRFEDQLSPHSVKNLLGTAAYIRSSHSLPEFLDRMHDALSLPTHRRVWPVSEDSTKLVATLGKDEFVINGESVIDNLHKNPLWDPVSHRINSVRMVPQVGILPEVRDRILGADYLVVSPGDIFTSIVPVLLAKGFSESVAESSCKIIMVMNAMTKPGETNGLSSQDHVRVVERYLGREIDIALCNSQDISQDQKQAYQDEHKQPVRLEWGADISAQIITTPLLDPQEKEVRHSPELLGKALAEIMGLGKLAEEGVKISRMCN